LAACAAAARLCVPELSVLLIAAAVTFPAAHGLQSMILCVGSCGFEKRCVRLVSTREGGAWLVRAAAIFTVWRRCKRVILVSVRNSRQRKLPVTCCTACMATADSVLEWLFGLRATAMVAVVDQVNLTCSRLLGSSSCLQASLYFVTPVIRQQGPAANAATCRGNFCQGLQWRSFRSQMTRCWSCWVLVHNPASEADLFA
jgi:hypothetical protein